MIKDKEKRKAYYRAYKKIWNRENSERLRMERLKGPPSQRDSQIKYYYRNKESVLEIKRKYYIVNKDVCRARCKSRYNISIGKIKKHNCEVCLDDKVVGHHSDYSKPLDVMFLCYRCHKLLHNKLKK